MITCCCLIINIIVHSMHITRALTVSIRRLPKDWRHPPRCPRHTWLHTLDVDLQHQNFGLNSATSVWKMPPCCHWTGHSGGYWQQAELCTELVQAEQWRWWWPTELVLSNACTQMHHFNAHCLAEPYFTSWSVDFLSMFIYCASSWDWKPVCQRIFFFYSHLVLGPFGVSYELSIGLYLLSTLPYLPDLWYTTDTSKWYQSILMQVFQDDTYLQPSWMSAFIWSCSSEYLELILLD